MTMYCKYCNGNGYHHPQCPSYSAPLAKHCCSICEEGIYDGEEYIENDCGECAHWDCVSYGRDLAKFLGYEIKEMDDENEWDY